MQWPSAGRKQESGESQPGVIETIGNAFALLNKRPYILLAPVLLDGFLWLGYRLSLAPLTNAIVRWIETAPTTDVTTLDRLKSVGSSVNLLDILTISTPSMMTRIGSGVAATGASRAVAVLPWWGLLPVILALAIIGLTIGMVYLTLLGSWVRDEQLSVISILRTSLLNTAHTIGFVLLVIGLFLLLSLPLIVLSGVLLGFGISIVPVSATLVFLGEMWAFVLLYFAQDAIVISAAGPARAIYMSYNLVRANFWPCLGLILASIVIQVGTPLALTVFTRSPWGLPLAFFIRAYVLTGLALAALLFYRDRARSIRGPKTAANASDSSS